MHVLFVSCVCICVPWKYGMMTWVLSTQAYGKQVYAWIKKYRILGDEVVCGSGDDVKVLSHVDRAFKDLRGVHEMSTCTPSSRAL